MHYANGQEAKAGDLVFRDGKNNQNVEILGILLTGNAASDTCNGMMLPAFERGKSDAGLTPWMAVQAGGQPWYVTIKELLPVGIPQLQPDPPPTPQEGK